MDIVDSHPESGIRIVLAWQSTLGGPPWIYEGVAYTPKDDYPVRAVVDAELSVVLEAQLMPTSLAVKVQTMVRAACARALQDGQATPSQIHSWRTSGSW